MTKQPNARFTLRDTKITMQPGERLNWYKHEYTDEGYSSIGITLYYNKGDEEHVYQERTYSARDCDGVVENYIDLTLDLHNQDAGWVKEHHRVYDQYAQAAGY
jgi:hypothetical protein